MKVKDGVHQAPPAPEVSSQVAPAAAQSRPVATQAETIRPSIVGEAALRAQYAVPPEVTRNGWTGSLDLARDQSPRVRVEDFGQWWSVRDNHIIEDVQQLDVPRAELEQRLRGLGFVPEGAQRGDQLAYIKTSIDSEMVRRVPLTGAMKRSPHQVLGLNAELVARAEPVDMGGLERYVQRVAVRYDGAGKLKDAYLLTYGWPTAGDGMNEDNIRLRGDGSVSHVLMNTTLEHSVAVPMSVNLAFAKMKQEG